MALEPFYFGSNIRYLRELDKMSKTQISKIIGVTVTEIGDLERNAIPRPCYQVVEAYALYFGVNIVDLVRSDLQGIEHTLDRDIQRLLMSSNGLHDQSVLIARNMLKGVLNTLSESEHYSIRRRIFKRDERPRLRSVSKSY